MCLWERTNKGSRCYLFSSFFKCIFLSSLEHMFIDLREWKGRGEKYRWERNTDQLLPTRALTEDQTCNLGPRHVPWPGIEPATFWCTSWCSNSLSPAPPPPPGLAQIFLSPEVVQEGRACPFGPGGGDSAGDGFCWRGMNAGSGNCFPPHGYFSELTSEFQIPAYVSLFKS